jgi:putative tryptophan/tyrosine transport system substrate-binding protein
MVSRVLRKSSGRLGVVAGASPPIVIKSSWASQMPFRRVGPDYYRWSIDNLEKARAAVIELLPLAPDVILANGTPSVQGLLSVTRTVPAVATLITEPVAMGFVDSLARPGGNVTGFTHLPPTAGGKLFDLLREIAPNVARVAYIFNPPSSPYAGLFYGSMQQAASKVGAQTTFVPVYEPAELEPVLAAAARAPGGGFVTNVDVFTLTHRKLIVELAARYKLPAIYQRRLFSTDGGLASYSVDDNDHFRQIAAYVDRILRGQKHSTGSSPSTRRQLANKLIDHLIGRREERFRHLDAHRLGCFDVND